MVLIIIGAVVYSGFISTLQSEVEASNISYLEQIKNNIDNQIKGMERTALHINGNVYLKAYKLEHGGYDAYEGTEELRQYKSGNEFISDIALLHNYREIQKIYTTKADYTIDNFLTNVYNYKNWNSKQLLELFNNINTPIMRSVEPVSYEGVDNYKMATYIYPLPPNTTKPNSLVLFMINDRVLKDLIKDVLKDYNGYVYILNEDGEPIIYLSEGYTDDEALKVLDNIEVKKLNNDISQLKVGSENFSVVKLTSEYNNWSYLTVMHTDQFMNKVYTKRTLFNLAIFFVLLVGIIASFGLAISSYSPLKKITEIIPIIKDGQKNEDEFTTIYNALNEFSNENKGLMSKLRSKAALLRVQIVLKLLKGRGNSQEYKSLEEISGIKLDLNYFAVLIMYIDDYNLFKGSKDKQAQELIKFSIINVVEELSQELGYGYGAELENDRCIALLLNFSDKDEGEKKISELSSNTKNFFREHFGFTITIGVGSIYDDVNMIHMSFLEAEKAIYYRVIKGSNNVIFYKDIDDGDKKEYKYPYELESKLLMEMKQGKSQEVLMLTKELKIYIENNIFKPEAAKSIYYGIINNVMKNLEEMEVETESYLDTEWDKIFLNSLETIDDINNIMEKFLSKLCLYFSQTKESKNFELRDKIIGLLEKHYCDRNLTLEFIVDECQVSQSYLCRYFKDHTGYSVMQYIEMLRINKVKKLLKETDYPLRTILDSVGYLDESNFIRKFKKKEGITPMQYRGLIQNEGSDH